MTRAREAANWIATGVTSTELDKLDGFTGTVDDLNYAKDLRATGVTATEFDKLDGFTGTVDDLNYAKDLNATGVTTTEFDKLDGLTASTAELNYVDGVTSAVQTQINKLDSQTSPHIIPGVLYPAVGGNDIHGTDIDTSHGSTYTYGTAHTDGRKYYYTDIKGSRPIHDPRVGSHFGSQRHKIKSLQLLEQETATQGNNVYSLDGRNWLRLNSHNNAILDFNRADGRCVGTGASGGVNSYFEIVGYFSDMNLVGFSQSSDRGFNVKVDGGTATAENNSLQPSINSPLGTESAGRYVDAGAVVNLSLNQTLGIHTVRVTPHASGDYVILYGIELIAQDKFTDATCDYNNDPTITMDSTAKLSVGLSVSGTGIPSGATVSSITNSTTFELSASTTGGSVTNGTLTFGGTEISIPAQDVVSYGKKNSLTHVSHHYDPFNGFTSGSSVTSYIDTATSLGVEKWKNSSTYYRPYNGGRVVKWVDSSGVIKTSVTLMPPNAKSIADSASLTNGTAKANASIANNTFYPTFEAHTTDVNEDNLHEVAKRYFWPEFGNGAANEGSTTSGSYQDASMLASNAADDIAYVMDDGLTSLSGTLTYDYATTTEDLFPSATGKHLYVTFIGTGISYYDESDEVWETAVQNLPYGTHYMSFERDGTTENSPVVIDGVQIKTEWLRFKEFAFHQPKKPPIPEDAVVLADYMLMADWVASTGDQYTISKGARYQSCSRDMFYDEDTNMSLVFSQGVGDTLGFKIYGNADITSGTATIKLPYFGTHFSTKFYASNDGTVTSGSDGAQSVTSSDQGSGYSGRQNHTYATLGANIFKSAVTSGYWHFNDMEVHTPIHTSHHYQTFETPFLHELVGGDRNMEQNNLVVSPDGKTWDEVTRNKDYLGSNLVLSATTDTNTDWATTVVLDDWRGVIRNKALFNKDSWAIAYDRLICLKDGKYEMQFAGSFNNHHEVKVNGDGAGSIISSDGTHSGVTLICDLKRGDYIQLVGDFGHSSSQRYAHFYIKKIN